MEDENYTTRDKQLYLKIFIFALKTLKSSRKIAELSKGTPI